MKTTAVVTLNPKVDAYIEKAAPFAQPILEHLRALFHKGCPDAVEEIKWSMPFFVYRGQNLGGIAAFKAHCGFGLWGSEIAAVMRKDGVKVEEGMGSLGKITSLKDLPSDKAMVGYIRQAAVFVEGGGKTMSRAKPKTPKAPPEIPVELTAALKKNGAAAKVFAGFSPSARREYAEWIAEAKRAETKEKRVAQAVEWIAEGKQRNWKYQNC
jgi:uncharacterized protein YdeI (YjbR/CyaY-like superfamily)